MGFLVSKIDRNVAADGIQLLTGRHIIYEEPILPAKSKDSFCPVVPCLLDCGGQNFGQKYLRVVFRTNERTDGLDGKTRRIVRVTVAAARHHKSLASVVHHLGLACFHVGLGTRLVTNIDVLAVLHGKGFYHLITLGCEDLTKDHEVGTAFYYR